MADNKKRRNLNEGESPLRNDTDYEYNEKNSAKPKMSTVDWLGWSLMALIIFISVVAYPRFDTERPTIPEVFYCGWMTAVSTGLGRFANLNRSICLLDIV